MSTDIFDRVIDLYMNTHKVGNVRYVKDVHIADWIGVSRQTWGNWKKRDLIPPKQIIHIADLAGVPVKYLTDGKGGDKQVPQKTEGVEYYKILLDGEMQKEKAEQNEMVIQFCLDAIKQLSLGVAAPERERSPQKKKVS